MTPDTLLASNSSLIGPTHLVSENVILLALAPFCEAGFRSWIYNVHLNVMFVGQFLIRLLFVYLHVCWV